MKDFLIMLIVMLVLGSVCFKVGINRGKRIQQRSEKQELQKVIAEKDEMIKDLRSELNDRNVELEAYKNLTKTTITCYTARPEECNEEPWVSAWNNPTMHNQLAVSRNLLNKKNGWMRGDEVYIFSLGKTFIIGDKMNIRWKDRVDILFHDLKLAKQFGEGESYALNLSKLKRGVK